MPTKTQGAGNGDGRRHSKRRCFIGLRVDEDLHDCIRAEAAREHRYSMSDMVRVLCIEALAVRKAAAQRGEP